MKTLIQCTLITLIALVASACGSAGWDYETVTSRDVSEIVAEKPSDREVVADWLAPDESDILLTHVPRCQRKDCAGPEAEYHAEIRQAALLLSTMRILESAAESASAVPYATRSAAVAELLRRRLPELRHRISETRARLEDSGLQLDEFEGLELAAERLEHARRIAYRIEQRLASLPASSNGDLEHASFDYTTLR